MAEAIPMLAEHQSIKDFEKPQDEDYQATADEKKVIKKVMEMFEKSRKKRKVYDENWAKFYNMFRGKQWTGEPRPSYRHSEVINMIFMSIQSTVPILTDSKPRISYLPQEPSDIALSEIMNQLVESDWTKNNWLMTFTEQLYDSHLYGTSFGTCPWNKEKNSVDYQTEDPFHCFPDPNAVDINKKSKFFITAVPTDLSVIRCNPDWKEKAKHVKSDLSDLANKEKTNLGEVRYLSPTDQNLHLDGEPLRNQDDGDKKALLMTCYWFDDDYDEEEKKETGPVDGLTGLPTEKITYVQKLKYPKGRKTVIAGGIVLEDGPNPYDDGKIPFFRLVNYVLPREFWGISEVEQLESPQKIFNKLVSFALDVLTLMGNPVWIISSQSGIDTDEVYNRPGLILEPNEGSTVKREAGVELQPYVLQMIDRMRGWFDEVSGANDVTRGARPEGVTAASAISELQDAAQTRIRQKSRNMDACLQDFGQQYASRRLQFTTAPQVFRLTNDQMASKFFKFQVETDPKTGKKTARVRHMNTTPDGQATVDPQDLALQIQGELDVKANTGSSLPFAKKERYQVALELFREQVIDAEELLKASDYPNWQQVLERVKTQQAQAAALQGGQPAA